MALPQKIKLMNLYNDGESYIGVAKDVSIPKLARKFEGYRAAGMDAEIQVDMGGETPEFEWKTGGLVKQLFRQFGATRHNAILLRFVGSCQSDSTGETMAVEIVMRGRHQEIDPGSAKAGDDTEMSIKTVCSYYKLTMDGEEMVEIDIENMIFTVDGEDILAEHRANLGL